MRMRAFLMLVATAWLATGCDRGPSDGTARARLSLSETLAGADTAGYARASSMRPFSFPEDHGPHPSFRTEWWYVTGNLSAQDGRAFGFQFTIFRSALAPTPPDLASAWATNQAYMGHFTLTDVSEGRFRDFERFARGAAGLAGAVGRGGQEGGRGLEADLALPGGEPALSRNDPALPGSEPAFPASEPAFRVWVEDWELVGAPSASGFPLWLSAAAGDVALRLRLDEGKPVVLQGDRGLSQKGPEPGNASYYYAHTRLPASGTVVVGADTLEVTGLTWLDREWSTSALSGDQVGWDWFSLQLDDGWEVMVYQLRLADGSADALSDGVLIDPEGRKVPLEWGEDLELEVIDSWRSPIDGTVYPSGWRLRAPEHGVDLVIEPVLLDQELDLAFRYWEGAVRVRGTGPGGTDATGLGYVELTGYAGAAPER